MNFLRPDSEFSVASGVDGFRTVMVNYFFLQSAEDGHSWVLVDAGLRGCGRRLVAAAESRFGAVPPSAIVLTHGHFDHVGALPFLTERWPTTPIYAHAQELTFLNDRQPYPPPDPTVGGGLMALSSPLYPRRATAFGARVRPLPNDGAVPGLSAEWSWLATPGHTSGHISLWRARDRVLVAGDALINTRQESAWAVLRQKPEVRPPPAYFTPDWESSRGSLIRLQALQPEVLASGHGQPARGMQLRHQLDRLVDEFETLGLPRHGRYVPHTHAPA